MAEYGNITTRSSVKQSLMEANKDYLGRKSWEQLYGSIDLAKQKQISELQQDYSKDMANAYASAYNQNTAIASSNLGQGYKLSAMESIDDALAKAYETYRSNYLQGVSEAESYASKAAEGVTEALDTQTENTQTMLHKPYEYLTWLREQYAEGDDEKDIFLNDLLWKRYTKDELDEEGNATGNRVLMSWDDLQAKMYDSDGNLTDYGTEFYDTMLNKMSVEQPSLGFNKWLAENDEKLYDWFASANPYDYDLNDNRNIGAFKKLVGMKSDDYTYSFIERSGAFTEKELDEMFAKFINTASELNDSNAKYSGHTSDSKDADFVNNQKAAANTYKTMSAELKSLTDSLGITKNLEKDLGMSLTELTQSLAETSDSVRSYGKLRKEKIERNISEAWDNLGVDLKHSLSDILFGFKLLVGDVPNVGDVSKEIEAHEKYTGSIEQGRRSYSTNERLIDENVKSLEKSRMLYNNLIASLIKYKNAIKSQR